MPHLMQAQTICRIARTRCGRRIRRVDEVPFSDQIQPDHNRNGWPASEFPPESGQPKGDFLHYYQHHIGDYRRDTAHLSLLEHGVYRQLLDLYYLGEQPIPNETDWVCRRLSAKTQEERNAIECVLGDFFTLTDAGWTHQRCDKEIEAYKRKTDANRENGKRGGRPPKTQSVSGGMPNENRTESEKNPNQEPITNNHKPTTTRQRSGASYDAMFDAFWKAYPKKVGKDEARRAFEKRKPTQDLVHTLLAALEVQTKSQAWLKDGGQFIPNPATWLHQGRWQDEVHGQADSVASILAGAI